MSTNTAKNLDTVHPSVQLVTFTCSCGASYQIQSALGKTEMAVEVCAQCHPFYTGEQKLIDTAGRVESFRRRYEKKVPSAKKAEPTEAESAEKPTTKTKKSVSTKSTAAKSKQ